MNDLATGARATKGADASVMTLPRRHERVELGSRDHALFLGLFEACVMLREQIAELFFAGSYEAASKRLQKLLRHGYLREREIGDRRGTYLPGWIALAEPGFTALRASGIVSERFTWETVRRRLTRAPSSLAHDLDVVDLWAAFVKSLRSAPDHSLKRFSTWPQQYQFDRVGAKQGTASPLLPDAFAVIAFTDDPALPPIESSLFFEWDRSTEWRSILRDKADGYAHFHRSGLFALRCGGTRRDVEDYPFRAVFAVKNEERRNNLLEELARPAGGRAFIPDQFWCTTWKEILSDPLGAIYLHIDDYKQATKGTKYDPAKWVTMQRVLHRDEVVRARAQRRRLVG